MQGAAATVVQLPRRRTFSGLEVHALIVGMIAAVVFFFGWGVGIEPLRTLLPGFPEMRPRTAFSLMMLSLCCMLSLRETPWATRLSGLIAGGMLIWIASLVVRYWGFDEDGALVFIPILATLSSIFLGFLAMLIVDLAPRFRAVAAVIAIVAVTPASIGY